MPPDERTDDVTLADDEEIEVTEEMIDAGMGELRWYVSGEDSPDYAREVVAAIFLAMTRLATKTFPPDGRRT